MSEKQELKRKKQAAVETPVHVVRAGAVTASIWQRQSPAGYVYLDYSLTRSFESLSSGNTGNSRNFFVRNRQELIQVIEQATEWIIRHEAKSSSLKLAAA